ncbi:MAG TPA: hypothetical protein P5155_00265 [Candidatus Absconditabacterales bacterium]|nr:hypothetical protein [Candidatus Absconditabacterales bacterium]
MDNKDLIKEWESYLEKDEKVHYKNKWNKLSKRFGKDILDNFENGRTYLKKQYEFRKGDKDLFKLSYKSFVRNTLLEKNNLSYIRFETSKSLMQLYSKYIGFMRKYEEDILENEEKIANEIQAEIEQEKMEKIFNNNQLQINTTLEEEVEKIIEEPGMRPIRDYEEGILQIDKEGNVLPPDTKPSNYFNDKSYTHKNYINKKNKGYNISTEEDGQLRIEFD